MEEGQEGGQPFSMHARGVSAMDSTQYLDCSYQLQSAAKEVRDISTSALLFFYLQSWQAMFVVLITVGSVSFFTYVGKTGIDASLNWTLVSFVVLLPSVLLLYLAFVRREQAQQDLTTVKTSILQIHWSFERSPDHQPIVDELLFSLMGILRDYLNAPRFYSRSYPLAGITDRMTLIARHRGKQSQQALLIFKNLTQCAEESAKGWHQSQAIFQLQNAIERLAVIKEYRLPQSLRVLVRFYVVLIIPIFYGPYYASISDTSRTFVFVLFFAVMMHLGMVAVMNAAIALEDPFSTDGVDGVYCSETLFEVEQAMRQGEKLRVFNYMNGNQATGKAQMAAPPPVNSMAAHGRLDQHAVDIASLHPLPEQRQT